MMPRLARSTGGALGLLLRDDQTGPGDEAMVAAIGVLVPAHEVSDSMLKFFGLDIRYRRVLAVATDPAPDSAFAPSFLGGSPGQLP